MCKGAPGRFQSTERKVRRHHAAGYQGSPGGGGLLTRVPVLAQLRFSRAAV